MNRSTKRALLVIKNFAEAEALKRYLELLGYSVDIANESLKACKLMGKRCPYQLLITELIQRSWVAHGGEKKESIN